jgi:GT2 family glycosyltransferase
MRVALVTIGYNLPGATAQLVASAQRGCRSDLMFVLILHSQIPEKVQEMEALAQRKDVIYRSYGTNRGLAKSWNEGILWGFAEGFDAVLVVNEDVVLGEGDVDRLSQSALYHRDSHIVTGRAYEHSERAWTSSQYGCFVVNPVALAVLGCFDENFFPLYCEDSDYRCRARLAGLKPAYCDTTNIVHGGSRSLEQASVARQNSVTYTRNRHYFRRKWGGEASSERFARPFDDDRFTHYIDPRVREAPYPGFNRQDQQIVQI